MLKKTISRIDSISYVFPLYNEALRLGNLFKYLDKNINKQKYNQEVIFVNDGSDDESINLIKDYISKKKIGKNNFKLISYAKNKGKGFALKTGVMASKNKWILTLDVDLSVDFSQLDIWLKRKLILNENKTSYFGSRVMKGSNVRALFFRKLIGNFYRILESLIIGSELKDTQCGYKLYNKSYSKKIFSKLKTKGFAHDIEIIFLLQKEKINIKELPVKWVHKPGSKINIMIDSLKMIFEMLTIRSKFK